MLYEMHTPGMRPKLAAGLAILLLFIGFLVWQFSQIRGQPPVPNLGADNVSINGEVDNLTITLTLMGYVDNGDGTFTVDYKYFINNPNNFNVKQVVATSSFSQSIPGGPQVQVVSFTSNHFSLNSNFNGTTRTQLLAGNTTLDSKENGIILLKVKLKYAAGDPAIINSAFISGLNAGGTSSSAPASSAGPGSTSGATSSAGSDGGSAEGSDAVTFSIGAASSSYTLPPNRQK